MVDQRLPETCTIVATVIGVPDIPGYRITGIIGEGGFATVYRGWQVAVSREVAVKVDNRVLLSERDQRRFIREVTAAGRLSGHPHVVDIYDAGTLGEGRPYMVMEFCPGGSLADVVRRNGVLPPAQVRDIGIDIADALAAAHAAGVLHRDIKPGNILVNQYGAAGLADFGLASILAPGQEQSVTRESLTPAYASPEQFHGGEPTVAGDLYSLAATLYTLLAGRPPRFPADGRRPSVVELISLHDKPVDDIPGVPPALMATLLRTLAVDPATRPRTAEELRDELIAAPDPQSGYQPQPGQERGSPTVTLRDTGLVTDHSTAPGPAGRGRHARTLRADTRVPARRRPKARLTAIIGVSVAVIAAAALLGAKLLSPGTHTPAALPTAPLTTQGQYLIERVRETQNFDRGCDLPEPVQPVAGADASLSCQGMGHGLEMTVSSFPITGPDIPFNPDLAAGESAGLNAYLRSIVPSGSPSPPTGSAADVATPCSPQQSKSCPYAGYAGLWGNANPVLVIGRVYCFRKAGTYYIVWTADNDEYEAQHNEDFVTVLSNGNETVLLKWWHQNV